MAAVVGLPAVRSVVVGVAFLLTSLAFAGCDTGSEQSRSAASSPAYPTPDFSQQSDELEGSFEVGNHELFIHCEGTGSPAVVHLHGLGGTYRNSFGISGDIAEDTRFCSYDRINMGYSDKALGRRTAQESVAELHTLLAAADIESPYVRVGASFGGLTATMYAAAYPGDVIGMVLLDGTLPTQNQYLDVLRPDQRRNVLRAAQANRERIDVVASLAQARRLLPAVPAVPMTYLAARPIEVPPSWPRKEVVHVYETLTEVIRVIDRGRSGGSSRELRETRRA